MSLNGLEAAEVNEAYQSALGEGGGWFLLKYTSRDEVGLLEKGNAGLAEAKEAVNRYEEQSPLFGFIQYRRRKVVLKYIPEGTSRLLQTRVAVHFQFVTEKLTPHDTVFIFTKPSELRDSKLSAACSLHTASASVKSSNESLPQRGLAEITEDASESPIDLAHTGKVLNRGDDGNDGRPTSGNSQSVELDRNISANHHHGKSPSITPRSPPRPRTSSSNTEKALPPTPGDRDKPSSPQTILDDGESDTRTSVEGRLSSQSARPSTRDPVKVYEYKPKVKLGPRPSMDSSVGRLDMSDGSGNFRPVSTLPAGLRLPPRKVVSGRPKSSQAQRGFNDTNSSRQPPPPAPVTPIQIPDRKTTVPNNGLLTPAKTPEPRSPKMTPEKRRLMKALQRRQKQLAAQQALTGLGIEAPSDEREYTKSEPEDSTLSAIVSEDAPPTQSDRVHVPIQNTSEEEHRNLEPSPISIPETCERPSTPASSITDDDEVLRQQSKNLSNEPENTASEAIIFKPLPFEHVISQHIVSDEEVLKLSTGTDDLHSQSGYGRNINSEASGQEADLLDEAASIENRQERRQLPSPLEEPTTAREEQVTSGGYCVNDIQASGVGGFSSATHSLQPKDIRASTTPITAEDAVLQTTPIGDAHELLEEGLQTQYMFPSQENIDDIRKPEAQESASSVTTNEPLKHVDPSEVPLPPIDKNEEIILSPPQALEEAAPSILVSPCNRETGLSSANPMNKRQSQESDQTGTCPPSLYAVSEQPTERIVRRQGVVNPTQRVSSPDRSEEQFLSDESFMEELKSATVQEAKPISVSKSPIKPVFSRSESEQRVSETRASRSVSSPLTTHSRDEETLAPQLPAPLSNRSFSASQPLRPNNQQAVPPLPKKLGVSTGISQRIKALEKLSARPTSPSSQVSSPNTSTFMTRRKTPQRTPPAASDVGHGNNNKSRPGTAYPSPSSPPGAVTSNAFQQSTKAGISRPESISVTATIIRDARNKTPETPLNLSEPRAMDLHQSPLLVEHQPIERQPMGSPPLSPLKPPRPRYATYSSARSASSSSTDQKGDASPTRRRDSFASIRSRSSRATSEVEVPRTISDPSLSGATTPDGAKEEKKDSKRSRLMKRMSSISSMSRRSIAQALSPSPKESPIMEHHEPIHETPFSSSTEVGDVNIQFPDTLLWKRRHMVIDDQGIIVLSASKSDSNSKVITKRYALSQFRRPYIPDQDRQELPHSVILDFIDGSTLQCACEHPHGQAGVLHALRQAHSVWAQ